MARGRALVVVTCFILVFVLLVLESSDRWGDLLASVLQRPQLHSALVPEKKKSALVQDSRRTTTTTATTATSTEQQQQSRNCIELSQRFRKRGKSEVGLVDSKICSRWDGSVRTGYSQSSQDCVLRRIFARIGTKNKFFVEFGFGYAKGNITEHVMDTMFLNTRLLFKQGWRGVYFDAVLSAPQFNLTQAVLTETNIGKHFDAQGIPHDLDYLSVDVDSIDLWLLQGVFNSGYRPRVFSIELNPNFPGNMLITFQRRWHEWTHHTVYGASAGASNFIASRNGYVVVHMLGKLDMFFVRRDVLEEHCDLQAIPTYETLSAYLPVRAHAPCTNDDLLRVVDLPLALEGKMIAANEKAVKLMKSLPGVCDQSAFETWARSRSKFNASNS